LIGQDLLKTIQKFRVEEKVRVMSMGLLAMALTFSTVRLDQLG
jgi:hypothetical protein